MSRAAVYRSVTRFARAFRADPLQFLGDRVVDLTEGTRLGWFDSLDHLGSESPGTVSRPVNNS